MLVGYTRGSTNEQNLELQIDEHSRFVIHRAGRTETTRY